MSAAFTSGGVSVSGYRNSMDDYWEDVTYTGSPDDYISFDDYTDNKGELVCGPGPILTIISGLLLSFTCVLSVTGPNESKVPRMQDSEQK